MKIQNRNKIGNEPWNHGLLQTHLVFYSKTLGLLCILKLIMTLLLETSVKLLTHHLKQQSIYESFILIQGGFIFIQYPKSQKKYYFLSQ